jgi:dienelactone hydrolase
VLRCLVIAVLVASVTGCGGAAKRPRPTAVSAEPAVKAARRHPPQRAVTGTVLRPPRGTRPGAPVVLWGGSTPGEPQGPVARRLAAGGHPVLSLAYFGAPGLPAELESIPLEYFTRAIRWFDRRRGVDGRRMVVYGVSRGSEAALLVGAHFPRLVRGVVAIAPSSKVYPAVLRRRPAWTLRGRPLPFALADDAGAGFDAPAVIPVERIRGPVLLAAGGRDQVYDSEAYERAIVRRLRRHGFGYRIAALLYRRAGHGITGREDLLRSTLRFLDGIPAD